MLVLSDGKTANEPTTRVLDRASKAKTLAVVRFALIIIFLE